MNISSFIADFNQVDETENALRIFDFKYTSESHASISKLNEHLIEKAIGKLVLTTALGYDINLNNPYQTENNGICTLKIEKSIACFFTESSFEIYLLNTNDFGKRNVIYLDFILERFASNIISFIPLTAFPFNNDIKGREEIRATKYVKDIGAVSSNFLPLDLNQWICSETEFEKSPKSWKVAAAAKLLSVLGNEFTKSELLSLGFSYQRIRNVEVAKNDKSLLFSVCELVNKICLWIYLEGKDIDTRHTLFGQQLGFSINTDKYTAGSDFGDILKVAFENANLTYRYHLSNSSKELNKILTDINKTLFEYSTKIRQNTADLATTLWRDFATVLAVVVLNFGLKRSDVVVEYFSLIAVIIALYVLISFYISASLGFWFYYNTKNNLQEWRNKLYGYLSDVEYENFAFKPLKRAFLKFKRTFFIVFVAYLMLLFFLFTLASTNVFLEVKKVISDFVNVFYDI